MRVIVVICLMLSVGLMGCERGEGSVKSNALYERLVTREQQDGWRILLCDVGQHGYLEFPKRPRGYQPPSLAPAGSSPENLKGVKLVEQLVRPDAIKTGVYSNVYLYSVQDRKAVPIFGIGETYDYIGDATFAPDGQRIALWVSTAEEIEAHRSQLALLDGEGHFQEKLLEAPSVGEIAWSSDGTKLAFMANYRPTKDKYIRNTQELKGEGALFIFNLSTGTQRILLESGISSLTSYAWSPDNREIVYVGIDDDILIYNFDTHQLRVLVVKGLAEGFPTWSPSGDWIAYMGAERNYYRIHPDGSGQELLLENFKASWWDRLSWRLGRHPVDFMWGPLVWSPDSQYLLYGRTSGPVSLQTMLYALDLKSGQCVRLGEFQGRLPLNSWVRTKKEP